MIPISTERRLCNVKEGEGLRSDTKETSHSLAENETIHLFAFLFLMMFAYISESRRRGGRLSTFQLRG